MGHARPRTRPRSVDDEGGVVATREEHVSGRDAGTRRSLRGAAGGGPLLQGRRARLPALTSVEEASEGHRRLRDPPPTSVWVVVTVEPTSQTTSCSVSSNAGATRAGRL